MQFYKTLVNTGLGAKLRWWDDGFDHGFHDVTDWKKKKKAIETKATTK